MCKVFLIFRSGGITQCGKSKKKREKKNTQHTGTVQVHLWVRSSELTCLLENWRFSLMFFFLFVIIEDSICNGMIFVKNTR